MTGNQQAISVLRVLNGLQALDACQSTESILSALHAYMNGLEGQEAYYDLSTCFGMLLDLIPDIDAFVNEVVSSS